MPNRKSKRISDRHKKHQLVDVSDKEPESNMDNKGGLDDYIT